MRRLLRLMLEGAPLEPGKALVHFENRLDNTTLSTSPMDEDKAALEFIETFCIQNGIELEDIFDTDPRTIREWTTEAEAGVCSAKLYLILSKIRANKNNLVSGSVSSDVDRALKLYESKVKASRPNGEFGYAKLTVEEKEELRGHLDHIRGIIDRSDIPDHKKNALFIRISNLQKEIDKEGTKTDEFFAFMGDLSMCVGQMAKNAQPATDELKAILRIVMRSRAANEQAVLPSNSETAMLPFVRNEKESD